MAPDPKPAAAADAAAEAHAERSRPLTGIWWRRVPGVLVRPREVLVALRSTDEDDEAARQEPVLAVVLLSGMTAVLLLGGALVDHASIDAITAAAVTFIAGGLYGASAYLVLGLGVWAGVRGAGGDASYRQCRHLVGFAAVPAAVSFPLVVAVIAAGWGTEYLVGEAGRTADLIVAGVGGPFLAWAAVLLVAGLRVTMRLAWTGVVAAGALAAVTVAAISLLPVVL